MILPCAERAPVSLCSGDIGLNVLAVLELVAHRGDGTVAAAVLERIGFSGKPWRGGAFASGFFPDTAVDFSRAGVVVDLPWSLSAVYFPLAPCDEDVWR